MARAGVDHDAGNGGVEPVHGVDRGGFVSERGAQKGRHAARLVRGENAHRLHAHDDFVVQIQYFHSVAPFDHYI